MIIIAVDADDVPAVVAPRALAVDDLAVHLELAAKLNKGKGRALAVRAVLDKRGVYAAALPLVGNAAIIHKILVGRKRALGLVKLLDRLGLLPRFVIDLSPFHTSLFITNLASINTEAIYHHCYEFGTTGVFVCMGKPVPNFLTGEYNKKIMPLGIVMDERICTGHEYALFWQTLRRYLKHPELTENGAEERAEMPEAVEA